MNKTDSERRKARIEKNTSKVVKFLKSFKSGDTFTMKQLSGKLLIGSDFLREPINNLIENNIISREKRIGLRGAGHTVMYRVK